MIEFFAFNTINQLLVDRVKGPNVLYNAILQYTKDEAKDNESFTIVLLTCIAACLRLTKAVVPFLTDTKLYLLHLVKLMKTYINNKEMTLVCLTIIKCLTHNEETTEMCT